MKNKLIKTMMIVLLVQVILFGIAIFGGNTVENISNEYLNILDNRVLVRKNDMQEEMLQRWSNIRGFQEYIEDEYKKSGAREDESLVDGLLEDMAEKTVSYLRQSGVTEIFVILEGEKGHEGIHLRDLDPLINTNDNSDILMERGSIDVAKKIGVPLDSNWSYKFNLSEEEKASEFYYKPYRAAQVDPEIELEDLGYWSSSFRLSEDDIEIITYSLPLLDEDGEPYGVVGVGLTVDYLAKKLKYDELADNKRGFYTLNLYDRDKDRDEVVLSSGPMYNIFSESEKNDYEKIDHGNIYKIRENEKLDGQLYASSHNLELYNESTPFVKEEWSITGFVEEKYLFKPIKNIIISVIISLVISLGIGIFLVYIVGTLFMQPINKLMKSVMDSDPNEPLKLIETDIPEIDKLSLAIEKLNNQVLDSAHKVSKIINMVNIPMGAFEYEKEGENAFYTNTFFQVLGIKNHESYNYVKKSYLIDIIKKIKEEPEIDSPNVYRYKKDDGKTSWIKLIMQEKDGKVLGVIEDVTEGIISKHKTEYERDHDVLTHLFNRRAFESIVKKKMEQGILGHSAFIMWDLDNLKYINDTYGHEYGDRYIQKAASVLKKFTMYNIIVARMSGDEFYTFIYGYKEKNDIRKITNEIRESLYNSFLKVPDGENIRIRASAGLAWYPGDSSKYDKLIKYSDFAMYEIKNKEKGNVAEFNRENYNKDSILLHGKEELNYFIDNTKVKYAFQAIIDAKTGEVFGYEALMRPQTKNLVSPYDVIRLAQSQSKLYEIERLTLFEVMKAYEKLRDNFKDAKLFINSIPNYSLSDEDLLIFEERFAQSLANIVIEITENEQSNNHSTESKQKKVKKWGSNLALDDFGSGYNGELSLLILSPKYVKIDMNIIRGIDKDINRQKLLKNILSYSKNRNIKIIAEGVETRSEMNKLIEFGVDYMQGYYLARPKMVPEELDSQVKSEIVEFNKKK